MVCPFVRGNLVGCAVFGAFSGDRASTDRCAARAFGVDDRGTRRRECIGGIAVRRPALSPSLYRASLGRNDRLGPES